MKKDTTRSLRRRSLLLLFMGCLFSLSATPSSSSTAPGVKKAKASIIIFSNWINDMEGRGRIPYLATFLHDMNDSDQCITKETPLKLIKTE